MAQFCFGVDVGGTTIKMGLFDTVGNVLDKWEIVTRTEDHGVEILPDIAKSIQAKMAEKSIEKSAVIGVGIGIPGPVDGKGVVYECANLGWGVFNVNDTLSEILQGIPVRTGNDANVAALGEMWRGGGQGFDNLVMVTLGTGVGGGIIVDGEILTGAIGAGGEIGHIHVQDGEPDRCGCGNYGCLEQYASATGMVRIANRYLDSFTGETCLKKGELSAKDLWDAVKAGDKAADEICEQFGKYLGEGLAAVACVTNPQIFVIGGGVSKAGEVILPYVEKNYKPIVFRGSRDAKFTLAKLGNDAGIYGAAKLVL